MTFVIIHQIQLNVKQLLIKASQLTLYTNIDFVTLKCLAVRLKLVKGVLHKGASTV